jgi:hypothetical protein
MVYGRSSVPASFIILGGAQVAANPENKWPTQDIRMEMAQEIRRRWAKVKKARKKKEL